MAALEPPKPRLHLSLLGVCRQIYAEANMMFWTANTFSFQDIATLRVFINGLHSTQKKKLTRMHVDFRWSSIYAEECTKTFGLSFISQLSGVRILHTTFDSHISVYGDKDLPIFWHRIRALPLRHVTVVIPDTAIPWSVGRRNMAEDL